MRAPRAALASASRPMAAQTRSKSTPTRERLLRQASFQGLREDKAAREVVLDSFDRPHGESADIRSSSRSANGQRAEAVAFLKEQLALYGKTSIRARLQKNINLRSLEGQPAPPVKAFDGPAPTPSSTALPR